MAATCCPHCDAPLMPTELAEGWCETCGKKVPAWVTTQARLDGHDPLRKDVAMLLGKKEESEKMTAGQKVLMTVFVLAVVFLIGSALMGDPKAIRGVAKVLGAATGVIVVGVLFALIKAVGSLFRRE